MTVVGGVAAKPTTPAPGEVGVEPGRRRTVFLSYARTDKAGAVRLVQALQGAGLEVWWDSLIEGGAEFARTIEAAIETCDAVVVLWSKASVASDWVLDEAAKGRDLHKLVPASLDGAEPPMGFRRYHSVNLAGWDGSAGSPEIDALVRGVASVDGRKSTVALAAATVGSNEQPSLSRRGVLIAVTGVAIAGVAGGFLWQRRSGAGRARAGGNSVAVLPFHNLSGDPDQSYFSDGLAEEVRATLARNVDLRVMAQASSAAFRDREEDARAIAGKLGVAFLLAGSVRRAGEKVRVAADLIDGLSGFSRWSQTFERRMDDIFAVQSEIATTVANELVARVGAGAGTPEPQRGTASYGGTQNLAAFDAYLRGRALYDLSVDEASERAALAQFDAAIAADPAFASAHAARARSLTAIANQYADVDRRGALYDAAIASAERAIGLAPDLADAHSTLGFTLFQGRLDAKAARAPFERSAQTGSGEATVMARYAQYSARVGREPEAAASMKRAVLLDPLNPLIHRAAGSIEYAARRYAESVPPVRQALAMNPKMSRAHASIGDALLMLGRLADARQEYAAEPLADFRLAGLAVVEHRLGNAKAAQTALAQLLTERGERALYQQGQVYAQWSMRDLAIERLEQARVVGDTGLIYARNDPLLDPLRSDPRFVRVLQSIGFDGV
jgi:TolB-like protein/tetratricopeptide (TPR) repeat protein